MKDQINFKTMNDKPQKPSQRKKPKQPKKITPSYLRNSGLFYLQRFTASSGHFKTVMLRKVKKSCAFHKDQDYEACAAMVEELTQSFIKERLLDDDGYVRGMITSLRRQGKSRQVIMNKLQQKRLDPSRIEKALLAFDEEHFEDPHEAEFLSALKIARKRKLGPYDTAQKYEPQKALSILARQGFSFDTSRRVLNLSDEDKEEAEHAVSFF